MKHLNMQSMDKVAANVAKIRELFPNCVTERINAEGKLEHAIDFDMLKQELSDHVVDGLQERYQFTWPDKRRAILAANAPINKTLRPCREESVDFDNTENLYIEGDNLEVLKLLQETYLGKVMMIYIDPPYNTGSDFVYNDDFKQDADEYIENSGQVDEEGNRLVSNTESNGRFHTDWLNMMYRIEASAKHGCTHRVITFQNKISQKNYTLVLPSCIVQPPIRNNKSKERGVFSMKQNKQLIRCLKKKLYGGRGLFSRTVDYIALRAIVFMGCYMWFSAMVANGVAKAMLSLASTGFISVGLDLINSLRLDSLIRAERRRVSAAALNDRLLLMTDDERNRLIAEHISKEGKQADRLICSVHRSEGPTPDDMLKAARAARKRGLSKVSVYYGGPLQSNAKATASACPDITFTLTPLSSLLTKEQLKEMSPSAQEADAAILAEFERERINKKAARTSVFAAGRLRGYIIAAACLTGLSFFVDNALYYRLMAAACLCFGATSWWLGKTSAEA